MKRILILLVVGICGIFTMSAAKTEASFPGGNVAMTQYLTENMNYPETAKENGIEGVVDVSFTVNPDGTIGSIKIVRMIDPDLEQEAIRLVKNMPRWTPASDNGSAIPSTVTVAIDFSL